MQKLIFIKFYQALESLDDEDRRLLRRLSSISLLLLFLNIIILADIATKTVTKIKYDTWNI